MQVHVITSTATVGFILLRKEIYVLSITSSVFYACASRCSQSLSFPKKWKKERLEVESYSTETLHFQVWPTNKLSSERTDCHTGASVLCLGSEYFIVVYSE